MRKMLLWFMAGTVALGVGIAIELVPQLDVIPLNGWIVALIGGGFVLMGGYGLVFRPHLLIVSDDGLVAPRQKLTIRWNEITSVRGFIHMQSAPYLLIQVHDPKRIEHFTWNRTKYWAIKSMLKEDEVPISLTGADLKIEEVVDGIQARLAGSV